MVSQNNEVVKTTTPIHKILLDEIDHLNPFKSRREFFEEACRHYLAELKRQTIYRQLEEACRQAADEDLSENDLWEPATLENWK
jgi:hypothetical protein